MIEEKNQKINRLRGFPDLDISRTNAYNSLVNMMREIAQFYSFKEVIVPSLENPTLFARSIGVNTDIVSKEMFAFNLVNEDEEKETLCLRPEFTSSLVRFTNDELSSIPINKLISFGSCFRKERPQQGRYREFRQFDLEIFGDESTGGDITVLLIFNDILNVLREKYGLKIQLQLNTIGRSEERQKYNQVLQEYFSKQKLSPISQERFKKGAYLRILDSKDDIFEDVPVFFDYLSEESKENFNKICQFLRNNNIDYVINSKLVRGLDYYNDLVFEAVLVDLNKSQNAVGGGGRFDGLFTTLGYKEKASVGFAIGLDRILDYIDNNIINNNKTSLGVIITDEKFKFNILNDLKTKYNIDILGNNIKKGLSLANKLNYKGVIFTDEIQNNKVNFKNLETSEQDYLLIDEILQLF